LKTSWSLKVLGIPLTKSWKSWNWH